MPKENLPTHTVRLEKIKTSEAPAAIGPYSQGVAAQFDSHPFPLIFVSGQLPIDPITGEMVNGGIKLLTRQVILNIQSILHTAKSSLQRVVKTEVFLIDLKKDFAEMNEEYAIWFTGQVAPARQTIQVVGLPRDSRIEISCIAF